MDFLNKLNELLIGPSFICQKHDWNMGTYCAACRDEALTAYRSAFAGVDLSAGKDWTAEKMIMKAPTEQQLNDPKWWDENAPYNSKKVGVAYIGGELWNYEFMLPGTTAIGAPCNAEVRFFSRPTKAEAKECGRPVDADYEASLPDGTMAFYRKDGEGSWQIWGPYSEQWIYDGYANDVGEPPYQLEPSRTQAERDKYELIQILLATSGQSEGVAADAILSQFALVRKGAE